MSKTLKHGAVGAGILAAVMARVLFAAPSDSPVSHEHDAAATPMLGAARPFAPADLPHSALRATLESLPTVEQAKAMSWLHRFSFPEHDVASIRADRAGAVLYVDPPQHCFSPICGQRSVATVAAVAATAPTDAAEASAQAVAPADAFHLHSHPGAPNVLYLDFTGHLVSGTAWNTEFPKLYGRAFSIDGNPDDFTDAERAAIAEIWHRVAEDFAPFDIDVTTEEPIVFDQHTGRVLITASTDALGNAMPYRYAGGVAYVDVWGLREYPTTYSPALVYYDNLSFDPTYIAEASSHEFGHNLGLSHDGTLASEYYFGHGDGPTSWAPIMGAAYNRNVSQWSKGEYADANNSQDDIAIITSHLGAIDDDHGNNPASATPLTISADAGIRATNPETDPDNLYSDNKGIIERLGDRDVFSLRTGAGPLHLEATPAWTAFRRDTARGANLDIRLRLLRADGSAIATVRPGAQTNAVLSTTVPKGTYYVEVSATPSADYPMYGSRGEYFITGAITTPADNQPPVAAFSYGCSRLRCSFTDASRDADGRIAGRTWLFGDGKRGTGSSVVHDYAQSGSYPVSLSVADDSGATATAVKTVTVKAGSGGSIVFADDFSDGTLAPWAQLQSGRIRLVSTPAHGWVLRKSANNDPSGGQVQLGATIRGFNLRLATRKVDSAGGSLMRYSITDADGNGYGVSLDFKTGKLALERRDAWAITKLVTSKQAVTGSTQYWRWHTLTLALRNGQLSAAAYQGLVDPAGASPEITIAASDATYRSFSRLNVNGGSTFDTADVVLRD